jgi:glycosyltransferase involved in cell wall biosynthesis
MGKKHIKLWILHAGLGHPSPYFYNLCNEFEKYKNIDIIVTPELPLNISTDNGIIYFNRLKRYYDSENINSVNEFLSQVDILKGNGWKLIFTLHNFFPIDRKITENDELLLKKFLPKMDLVFTFTNYMKDELKKNFGIEAINHSIGPNTLDNSFDKKINIPNLSDNSFVFTFIGNISEYKMLEDVISNFKKIKNDNTYLIIAGPNSRNYQLKYKADSNIIKINEFIGDSSWKELSAITNIFINTYDINRECFKYGFFPSNCIQIMQQKKICIVPKSSIMSEILPQGYYYNYKDSYDLYKTMKRVIKEQKEIKYKEKTYPDCDYSWERMVNIIVKGIKEELV